MNDDIVVNHEKRMAKQRESLEAVCCISSFEGSKDMMNFRNIHDVDFPEINFCWMDDGKNSDGYKNAYSLMRVAQLEKCQDEMAGIITVTGMNHVIPIVPSDAAMAVLGFVVAGFCYITDAYLPAVFLEEKYFRMNRHTKDLLCTLYHEIGHCYLKHLKKSENLKEERMERLKAAETGEVYWIELEADTFACHYVGKSEMLRHLQTIKKLGLKKGIGQVNIAEVDKRADFIRAMSE